MFSQIHENPFVTTSENPSCPRTPTLPGLQEGLIDRTCTFKHRNLKIITTGIKALASPVAKTSKSKRVNNSDIPIRRNLFGEVERFSESLGADRSDDTEVVRKRSLRSMSTSNNDKGKHYLNEISNLNTKIRNLIKEQDNLRDKLLVQENIIMNLQRDNGVRPVVAYHEIQSATIPQHDSLDDSFFQVTFKPNEKWVPKSRRFPRDVFCKISKVKYN